jgi:hypothetical protein
MSFVLKEVVIPLNGENAMYIRAEMNELLKPQ